MFLPAAFLQIDDSIMFLIAGFALLGSFMLLGLIWVVEKVRSETEKKK